MHLCFTRFISPASISTQHEMRASRLFHKFPSTVIVGTILCNLASAVVCCACANVLKSVGEMLYSKFLKMLPGSIKTTYQPETSSLAPRIWPRTWAICGHMSHVFIVVYWSLLHYSWGTSPSAHRAHLSHTHISDLIASMGLAPGKTRCSGGNTKDSGTFIARPPYWPVDGLINFSSCNTHSWCIDVSLFCVVSVSCCDAMGCNLLATQAVSWSVLERRSGLLGGVQDEGEDWISLLADSCGVHDKYMAAWITPKYKKDVFEFLRSFWTIFKGHQNGQRGGGNLIFPGLLGKGSHYNSSCGKDLGHWRDLKLLTSNILKIQGHRGFLKAFSGVLSRTKNLVSQLQINFRGSMDIHIAALPRLFLRSFWATHIIETIYIHIGEYVLCDCLKGSGLFSLIKAELLLLKQLSRGRVGIFSSSCIYIYSCCHVSFSLDISKLTVILKFSSTPNFGKKNPVKKIYPQNRNKKTTGLQGPSLIIHLPTGSLPLHLEDPSRVRSCLFYGFPYLSKILIMLSFSPNLFIFSNDHLTKKNETSSQPTWIITLLFEMTLIQPPIIPSKDTILKTFFNFGYLSPLETIGSNITSWNVYVAYQLCTGVVKINQTNTVHQSCHISHYFTMASFFSFLVSFFLFCFFNAMKHSSLALDSLEVILILIIWNTQLDNEEKSEYLIFVNSHQDSVRNKDFIFILRSLTKMGVFVGLAGDGASILIFDDDMVILGTLVLLWIPLFRFSRFNTLGTQNNLDFFDQFHYYLSVSLLSSDYLEILLCFSSLVFIPPSTLTIHLFLSFSLLYLVLGGFFYMKRTIFYFFQRRVVITQLTDSHPSSLFIVAKAHTFINFHEFFFLLKKIKRTCTTNFQKDFLNKKFIFLFYIQSINYVFTYINFFIS
ncbi:hypothetical protein VP01_292g2 [Puccinia sorghi]|uniref:Uncharacterized protein n=1 Tax=Puccinia sorghi TaxID=27349 RepID=A0A0L6V141_9BASI|nr:hypothetical protein VP01_292g2 [Puccinia sorghi]